MSLPDPHSGRLRHINSKPRRRDSDPGPRRRREDHRRKRYSANAFLTTLTLVFFCGYLENYGGFAAAVDSLAAGLGVPGAPQNAGTVVHAALAPPLVLLCTITIALFLLLRYAYRAAESWISHRCMARREMISLDKFKYIARENGIRPRVAAQGYRLLLPFYRSSLCTRTSDRLREDLGMSKDEVQRVAANLLRLTERKAQTDLPVRTVLDLLKNVQHSTKQLHGDAAPRAAAADREVATSKTGPARKRVQTSQLKSLSQPASDSNLRLAGG